MQIIIALLFLKLKKNFSFKNQTCLIYKSLTLFLFKKKPGLKRPFRAVGKKTCARRAQLLRPFGKTTPLLRQEGEGSSFPAN